MFFLDGRWRLAFGLGLAAGFYLLVVGLGRLLKRRAGVPLSWVYHPFALSVSLLAAARCLHLELPGARELGLAALVTAAFPLNAVLYRFFWPMYGYPGENPRIPGFLPQVVAILVFLGLSFSALTAFYHLTITGLLAGSGVIALIIGLALQDTLGNIFAGFGLQAGHAFKVGDWLILQGQPVQVVEITWRSTRFRNNDDVSFNVPNSHLAKETIVNVSFPTTLHAVRMRVTVDSAVPPNFVKDALVTCAGGVTGVHSAPPPAAYLTAFEESGITYELKFWIDDDRLYLRIMDAVRTNCWYEFDRRRIAYSVPVRLLGRSRTKNLERDRLVFSLLSRQPLFASLSADQIELLAAEARWMRFGRGEIIIRQGTPGDSMFILGAGTAQVFSKRDGRELRVGGLHAGDCFGEISFLTGEARSATVNASEDCEVVEISKHAMGVLLHQQPALAEALSETLVQRRTAIQEHFAHAEAQGRIPLEIEGREGLLRRLRAFFEL